MWRTQNSAAVCPGSKNHPAKGVSVLLVTLKKHEWDYILESLCNHADESKCGTSPVKSEISNNVGPVKIFFERTSPFHSVERSLLWFFVVPCIDDHGSFGNLAVGFSPTQRSLRSQLRP